ncbi:nuclease-related domain-containing protein [Bhargavaea ullalensis]|uniref:Zn-finger protein n=1 Tax=Bhargavaea ullalensis TaxID=1265685 RepID=A0ABV2GEA2_9BACL
MAAVKVKSSALLIVDALESIIERFRGNHEKRQELEQQLYNRKSGIAGEQKVLDALYSIQLPRGSRVFWDISLPLPGGSFFQVDVILIMPSGILLLESKNIGGRLRFYSKPSELHKVDENGTILLAMDCPFAQLQDQKDNMDWWLANNGFRVKTGGLVVLTANPTIEAISRNSNIIRLRELRSIVRRMAEQPHVLSAELLKTLTTAIQLQQRPYLPFPYAHHVGVEPEHLEWRPLCELCLCPLDKPTSRSWFCPNCRMSHVPPYKKTLLDRFLTTSNQITTAECSRLFKCNERTALRILEPFNLTRIGNGPSSAYQMEYLQLLE